MYAPRKKQVTLQVLSDTKCRTVGSLENIIKIHRITKYTTYTGILCFICFELTSTISKNSCFFGLQVAAIRQHLANIYEREQNWRDAANVLVGIPLETGQK